MGLSPFPQLSFAWGPVLGDLLNTVDLPKPLCLSNLLPSI